MDSKNLTIGALSTTAVILLVGLVIVHSRPTPAYGSGTTAQSSAYVMTTGFYRVNEELLYVTDVAKQRMVIYRVNPQTRQIEMTDAPLNLDTVRARTGSGR